MTSVDLVRFRVIYAAVMLMLLPSFTLVAAYPDSLYRPPPGPFEMLAGFPPLWILASLEVALALALAALLVGYWVGIASVAVTVLMVAGLGFSYSLGKIDHNILPTIAPLFLLAAGWSGRREPREWVMRLLAWTIGLSFLTAGLPKLMNGWLDPATQATRGWFVESYYSQGRTAWLADWLIGIKAGWLWEPMDWAAVLLELSIVVLAVCSWRAWRAGLVALTVFHLGVLLMLNINFADNVLVYAAFAPWGRLPWRSFAASKTTWLSAAVISVVLAETVGGASAVVRTVALFAATLGLVLWAIAAMRAAIREKASTAGIKTRPPCGGSATGRPPMPVMARLERRRDTTNRSTHTPDRSG